jgi:hypothetical protein
MEETESEFDCLGLEFDAQAILVQPTRHLPRATNTE